MVERTLVAPPRSRNGPITDEERQAIIGRSPIKGQYAVAMDRESAYELLKKRESELVAARQQAQQQTEQQQEQEKQAKAEARRKKLHPEGAGARVTGSRSPSR